MLCSMEAVPGLALSVGWYVKPGQRARVALAWLTPSAVWQLGTGTGLARMTMKVLIQNVSTEKYIASGRNFTSRIGEARDFQNSPLAWGRIRKEKRLTLRVVYYFEEQGVVIPARGGGEEPFFAGGAITEGDTV